MGGRTRRLRRVFVCERHGFGQLRGPRRDLESQQVGRNWTYKKVLAKNAALRELQMFL